MKIETPGRVRQTGASRKTGKTRPSGGTAFQDALKEVAGHTEPQEVVGGSSVESVDALLAIQEVGAVGEKEKRERALRHGQALLDQLEDIRLGLLSGSIPAGRLQEIGRMVSRKREATEDPGLNQLLDEIELRVKVELAKLGQ